MTKIDNEKMWASMLNYEPTKEERERLGKTLRTCEFFPFGKVMSIVIRGALREQGLMEKDGEIVDYEPQFKVGDWLVDKDGRYSGRPFVVTAEHENVADFVTVQFQDGSEFQPNVFWLRKWEITDARDGDILVQTNKTFGTMIFICAGFAMNGNTRVVDYHIMYNTDTGFVHKKAGDFMGNLTLDFHPATQEQREMLFDKMHAAGFDWDDDKKQVVKMDPVSAYDMTDDALKIVEWLYVYDMKLIGLCRFEMEGVVSAEDAYIVTVQQGYDEDGEQAVVITYPNNKKLYLPQGMHRAKDLQPHIKRLGLRVIPPCSKESEGWNAEGIKED